MSGLKLTSAVSTPSVESARAPGQQIAAPVANGLCVTLYNEPWSQLRESLVSILISLEQASSASSSASFICVVADGVDRIAPDVHAAMQDAGLLSGRQWLEDGLEIHVSEHDISQLLLRWGALFHPAARRHRVNLVVCLKATNRGKLDSHVVFFENICARLGPEICYQIDAGTVLAPDAIAVMTAELRSAPSIAAITPCLTPPKPEVGASLLYTWQFHDFALRQAALLPVESLLDVLGVMPGQVSAFRWQALRRRRPSDEQPTQGDPLWSYLHGIAAHSPLRRLMYLSEDRIIGSALILDREDAWSLKYEPGATATTDYCETLDELLRQRRRWTNSAMVCRLWLLGQWKRLWTHASRTTGGKTRQSAALVLQLLVGVREFIAPAHLLALLVVLGQIAIRGTGTGHVLLGALLATSVGDLLASLREVSTHDRAARRRWRVLAATSSWISATLFMITLLYTLPARALLIALVPAIAVFACMSLVLPMRVLPAMARTHFAPIQYSLLSNVILAYSLWNMNDASWGTKGLTASPQDELANRQLRMFRRLVLCAWVGANALALWLAAGPGMISPQLNPVVECVCLMDLAIAAVAFTWLLVKRAGVGRKARRGRA